jgi:hypothetical protein
VAGHQEADGQDDEGGGLHGCCWESGLVWDFFPLEVGKLFWWLVDVVVVVVVDGGLRFRIDRGDQRVLIGTASDGSASAS